MTTNDLRQLIVNEFQDIKTEYALKDITFNTADPDKMYPHIVLTLTGTDLSDLWRKDYTLDVDIYTKGAHEEIALAYDVADAVETRFQNLNAPEDTILPTFFLRQRIQAEDTDRTITHLVVRIQVQLYEREVEENGNID